MGLRIHGPHVRTWSLRILDGLDGNRLDGNRLDGNLVKNQQPFALVWA